MAILIFSRNNIKVIKISKIIIRGNLGKHHQGWMENVVTRVEMEYVDSHLVEAHGSHEQVGQEKSEVYSIKRKQSLQARYTYGFIFFITNILAWLFRDYGHKVLHNFLPKRVCGVEGKNCVRAGGIFFSFMCLTTFSVHKLHEARNSWHSGWWPLKTVVYLLLIVVPFITPENIIQIYGNTNWIFLLLQLISMTHFLTWCDSRWMSDLQPNKCGLFGLFFSTIFCISSFVGIILMYYLYALERSCIINIFFITWTAILVKAMMMVSLHSKVNMGLLSSAIMGAYIVFLCWSAIQSEPPIEKCNTRKKIADVDNMTTILSFFIAIGAIVMATFSTGTDSHLFQLHKNEVESEVDIPYKYETFHFIFAMGSMYFAMLFINWELHKPTRKWSIDVGWTSTWVKIVNQWIAAGMYLWKLIYPLVTKDTAVLREESVQNV
ncbi:putative serine incorporator [Canna indica]|uniref:Serine incorporator n=1 Tax=Canna indica TaxID=4628 RepID=A0AAQ3QDR8_9LILI|nr:putative serine incorporator [Canna indica]